MITRKLNKETDYEQFAEVSSAAYIHNSAETAFNEKEDIFGTFIDDGKILISQVESIFKNCWYGENLISCAMVGGVASKPEYRRMGGVRETFKKVFENSIEKGAVVSILYPFSISYYRQFGYEIIGNYISAECSFNCFKKIERFTDVKLLKENTKDEFSGVYTTICKKHNMMFERPDLNCFSLNPYNSCKFTYFVNNSNSKGYVTFFPDRSTRTLEVNEIAFTDKPSLLNLLGFLRTYDGNYDTVNFTKLPQNSVIPDVLDYENRTFKRSLFKDGAGRILDVKAVLESNTYPENYGKFSLKVTDPQIEQNNGIFTVEYENGKCTVEKSDSGDFDISLDISLCSRLLLGREGLSLEEITYLTNVEIKTDCKDFLNAFPKRTTQFFDGF